MDWNAEVVEQLSWHWDNQLRSRLDGLSDEEYFWEPVSGAWSVRPRGAGATTAEIGSGEFIIDFAYPEPTPPPVTTIAWRLSHLLVGVFGARLATHFAGTAVDYSSYDYPGTADDALSRLDDMYSAWIEGVRSLSEDDLARPSGEYGFETAPMAALVLHIHREVIHHGAEICLLRDLFAWQG